MTKKELEKLSILQLEEESYKLTAERKEIRKKALLVQKVMSRKIETERVAKILGKPPIQEVVVEAIDEPEQG